MKDVKAAVEQSVADWDHEQTAHGGGPCFGLMGLGAFVPDYLTHPQGLEPRDTQRRNESCH